MLHQTIARLQRWFPPIYRDGCNLRYSFEVLWRRCFILFCSAAVLIVSVALCWLVVPTHVTSTAEWIIVASRVVVVIVLPVLTWTLIRKHRRLSKWLGQGLRDGGRGCPPPANADANADPWATTSTPAGDEHLRPFEDDRWLPASVMMISLSLLLIGGTLAAIWSFTSIRAGLEAPKLGKEDQPSDDLVLPQKDRQSNGPIVGIWDGTESTDDLKVRADEAWRYLVDEMDRWTHGTVVYDDWQSGGAGFWPTNWMGDADDLKIDENWKKSPAGGTTCLRITYRPQGPEGWAGVYWAYPRVPGGNWGQSPGRRLHGATRLRGYIRGQHDGQVAELGIGGVNRYTNDPAKPFRDAFGPIKLQQKLTHDWKPFEIEIPPKSPVDCVVGGFCITFNKSWLGAQSDCVVFLDEVSFDDADPQQPRFIRSYTPTSDGDDDPIRNSAFLCDNCLAILAFLARGDDESLRRARILADSLVCAQTKDRAHPSPSGPWRNAYLPVLIDPATNTAQLPGIFDPGQARMLEDRYAASSDTGNQAWAIIALLAARDLLPPDEDDNKYLRAACRAGDWVEHNFRVNDDLGGYSGGLEGWDKTDTNPDGKSKLAWRSCEHCIHLAVAFAKLAAATGDERWLERSEHAKRFVLKMWNVQQRNFWAGTTDEIAAINKEVIPADVQTWALLALGHDPAFRTTIDWQGPPMVPRPLDWVLEHCREELEDGTFFKFSAQGRGAWPEGSAHVAACLRYLGDARGVEAVLRSVAALPDLPDGHDLARQGDGVPVARGGIMAAWPGPATTGFEKLAPSKVGPWLYRPRPHVGATAWFLLAVLGRNPYWLEGSPDAR